MGLGSWVWIAGAVGLAAGLHTASWGMYKDAPHEGFTWPRFFRSPVLATLVAIVALPPTGLDLSRPGDLAVFFGFVYIVERAMTEFYKTFLRSEDQSKYFIPMQFHVGGRVVEDDAKRWLIGAAYAAGVLAILGVVRWLDRARPLPPLAAVVLVGGVGGWISAVGGAWKDGPIEGFQILKFFRSPLIAVFWALVLGHVTRDYLLLVGAATGYTVATTETYKTFFFPDEPRGKFAGMPVHHPEMLHDRHRVVPLYAAIWVAALVALGLGLAAPHDGLVSFL